MILQNRVSGKWFVWKIMHKIDTQGGSTMPEPIEDLNRDHQCHHYQAPTGQRCGSPALKGEYYCYHHHIKNAARSNRRVLIDPEVTCMELPPIEDRASIFVALAAVVHRLAENTVDTRRAGQMIYGLPVALRALEPARDQRSRTSPAADFVSESQPTADTAGASSTTDRKSTRLNSSHLGISYAVFCLK